MDSYSSERIASRRPFDYDNPNSRLSMDRNDLKFDSNANAADISAMMDTDPNARNDQNQNDKRRSSFSTEQLLTEAHKKIEELTQQVMQIQLENSDLIDKNQRLKNRNSELKRQLMKSQQYRRRSSMALYNLAKVTKKAGEALQHQKETTPNDPYRGQPVTNHMMTQTDETGDQVDAELAREIEDDINNIIQEQIHAAILLFQEEFGQDFDVEDPDWADPNFGDLMTPVQSQDYGGRDYGIDKETKQIIDLNDTGTDNIFRAPKDTGIGVGTSTHDFGQHHFGNSVATVDCPDTVLDTLKGDSDVFYDTNGKRLVDRQPGRAQEMQTQTDYQDTNADADDTDDKDEENPVPMSQLPCGGMLGEYLDVNSFVPVTGYESDDSERTFSKVKFSSVFSNRSKLLSHDEVQLVEVQSAEGSPPRKKSKAKKRKLKDRSSDEVDVHVVAKYDDSTILDLEKRFESLSERCMGYMQRIQELTEMYNSLEINKIETLTRTAVSMNEYRELIRRLGEENTILRKRLKI